MRGNDTARATVAAMKEVGTWDVAYATLKRELDETRVARAAGAFESHWFPYDRVGVVNADP